MYTGLQVNELGIRQTSPSWVRIQGWSWNVRSHGARMRSRGPAAGVELSGSEGMLSLRTLSSRV